MELKESFAMKTTYVQARFPEAGCPQLRPALVNLFKECQKLTDIILQCLSLSLGKDKNFLASLHRGALAHCGVVPNLTTLRVNHYPPVTDKLADRPGVVRCGQHTDYGTITLLFQVRSIITTDHG